MQFAQPQQQQQPQQQLNQLQSGTGSNKSPHGSDISKCRLSFTDLCADSVNAKANANANSRALFAKEMERELFYSQVELKAE